MRITRLWPTAPRWGSWGDWSGLPVPEESWRKWGEELSSEPEASYIRSGDTIFLHLPSKDGGEQLVCTVRKFRYCTGVK